MEITKFLCPNCQKAYRWQSKIAGKRVRCVCGQKFRVPMSASGKPVPEGPLVGKGGGEHTSGGGSKTSGGGSPTPKKKPKSAPEPDPYELDLPEEPKAEGTAPLSARSDAGRANPTAGASKCPSCNSPLRAGAVICLNCGFNVAAGSKLKTVVDASPATAPLPRASKGDATTGVPGADRVLARTKLQDDLAEDMARRHHFQENLLPLIFLGAGLLLLLVNAFVLVPMLGTAYGSLQLGIGVSIAALIYFFILFLVQLPCLFVGILVISKLFGSAFGTLTTALKKLAALALLGGQFHLMVDLGFDIMLGGFGFIAIAVKFSLSFGLFWILSKQLFDDLEFGETVTLWLAMLFLPIFAVIGVIAVVMIMFA